MRTRNLGGSTGQVQCVTHCPTYGGLDGSAIHSVETWAALALHPVSWSDQVRLNRLSWCPFARAGCSSKCATCAPSHAKLSRMFVQRGLSEHSRTNAAHLQGPDKREVRGSTPRWPMKVPRHGPGGHLKIPHPWPGQTPPPDEGGTRVRGCYAGAGRFATRAAASFKRQLLPSNFSRCP